ncbi:hypothetical protein PISMIDRAFT_682320 [Pisolithus microcarpus 441]|uniref:Secreted protein n=1 Tax=Pisolithus microcarpus 441 TaxID=765257 RepID=A0A0C9Z2W3_9AGAM|nr:hypothetical protein PISMIDRAFT_682320 [Pisolithus microcarpus 441]
MHMLSGLFILFDAVCLHQTWKAAVGVALKPPDESFRRLETALLTFGPTHHGQVPWEWRYATTQPVIEVNHGSFSCNAVTMSCQMNAP